MIRLTPKLKFYARKISVLSQAIVEAQKPIRILDAIKWNDGVDSFLLKHRFRKIPSWGIKDYQSIQLGFNPQKKIKEFSEIIGSIRHHLGPQDRVGALLKETCLQYQDVCLMLEARGTKKFSLLSQKLYGSVHDKFFDDKCTVKDLGQMLKQILAVLDIPSLEKKEDAKKYSSRQVVKILNKKFDAYFHRHRIFAEVSDTLVADAAAGNDCVRLRSNIRFSKRDVDILEVHEGWVHVGTTLNGLHQKYAKWLAKGPPRVTVTQEGLAVMLEIFTFRASPRRMQRINDRLYGIHLVEEGANIIELAEFYRKQGYEKEEILYNVRRIFRGAPFTGGFPFTKDICYAKGFIENYNFIRTAMAQGYPELIPFLFSGKLHISDIPLIFELYCDGLVEKPYYLPPLFKDLNGLAVWMSFSNFLNSINLPKIRHYYQLLFSKIPHGSGIKS